MADKCKTCGGTGVVIEPLGRWTFIRRCDACERFASDGAAIAHVHLCCEARDELLAACDKAATLFDELLNTDALNLHSMRVYNLAAALHAHVAKAQPVKEPTPA